MRWSGCVTSTTGNQMLTKGTFSRTSYLKSNGYVLYTQYYTTYSFGSPPQHWAAPFERLDHVAICIVTVVVIKLPVVTYTHERYMNRKSRVKEFVTFVFLRRTISYERREYTTRCFKYCCNTSTGWWLFRWACVSQNKSRESSFVRYYLFLCSNDSCTPKKSKI